MRALDEIEPPYDEPEKQPKTLTRTRHIDDVLYVAGRAPVEGQAHYDIMFVNGVLEEDEATSQVVSTFGFRINQPPEYLKGATGVLRDVAMRAGLDMDKCYYTAICKWLLPRSKRTKPSVKMLKWGLPILMDEIQRVKPRIIVCLGKPAFDLLSDRKMGFDDAHGGWFWSTAAQAHLYLMHAPHTLILRPEYYETFRVDFAEIARKKAIIDGKPIEDVPVRYDVIRDEQTLRDWVARMEEEGHTLFAADCEWHGRNYYAGQLRTIQFAWSESDAVVIEFRNENNEWSFELEDFSSGYDEVSDAAYAEAKALGIDIPAEQPTQHQEWSRLVEKQKYAYIGRILGSYLNGPDIRYLGHHFSADAPWMEHWLGLNTLHRCLMDTEFAQQTVDESSELSLERGIAMKYTTLGMYNMDLVMWKKDNPGKTDDGYGYIPSEILLPYSILDVITTYRGYQHIKVQLEAQDLWNYYQTILNPFVTDVFTEFHMVGLPMDIKLMDELRELFHFVRRYMEKELQLQIFKDAQSHFRAKVLNELGIPALKELLPLVAVSQPDQDALLEVIKRHAPMESLPMWIKHITHLVGAPSFNIRSPDAMRRWLFDVEGLEPIKSTNQKAKGLPSQAWEKVLELPPERQKLFTPAVDKQTLQILGEKLPTLQMLLDLNAVGNICKAFLKEADTFINDDGEVETSENGLHKWLVKRDGLYYICPNYSLTETARSRSWAPNTLNYPAYVNKRISRSVVRVINEAHASGALPDTLMNWVGAAESDIPSIRSCITAPEGWVMCESDYQTAEIVALSKISGDRDLQRILEEPDPEWAILVPDNPYKAKAVRVSFSDPADSGIPVTARRDDYIMHVWKDGKKLGAVTDDMLMRDSSGNVKHAKYDIHWSISERIYARCRESMTEKVERNAGKTINFCIAEDQLVLTKDRGSVPIQDVRLTDRLWDGDAWVSHSGVVARGRQKVYEYQGLWATPNHQVWIYSDFDYYGMGLPHPGDVDVEIEKVSFETAVRLGADLVDASDPYVSALDRYDGYGAYSDEDAAHDIRQLPSKTCNVYDILNVGPNRRFTCSGVLVSNSSAYGASPSSLERKIEADTGVKPEPGTGQKGLDAIAARQPRASQFLQEMAEVPKRKGYYRCASGRIRHCVLHGAGTGVGWRVRNSIESALGREMRNLPMQESVGATAARACRMAMRIYTTLGMKARIMTCLYDSLVTLCPLEERFLVARIHTLVMSELNTWRYVDEYGDRVLQYGVDNEFNYRWSTRPSKAELAQLDDQTWHPTPERLQKFLTMQRLDLFVS